MLNHSAEWAKERGSVKQRDQRNSPEAIARSLERSATILREIGTAKGEDLPEGFGRELQRVAIRATRNANEVLSGQMSDEEALLVGQVSRLPSSRSSARLCEAEHWGASNPAEPLCLS